MAGRNLLKQIILALATLAGALLPSAALAATTPAFTLTTPLTATFPTTAAGATSASQTIVLTTTRAVTIASVAIAQTVNAHQEFTLGTMTGCTIGTSAPSGTACSIPVTFTPYYTGLRQQTLTVTDSTGLIYTVGLQGFSDGAQTLLTPTSANTNAGVSGGAYFSGDGQVATNTTLVRLGLPEGVFIDNSNNIFYADYSTNNVRVIYQTGTALACLIEIEEPTLFGLNAGATSCAGANSTPVAGNIYTIAGDTTPYSTTVTSHPTGSTTNVLAAGTGATTLYSPSGVTVDSNGNVIVVNYGSFTVRVIYSGGDSMACLIEVENPTLFGLSPTATSCVGASSAPQPGFIYSLANTTGTANSGTPGDGGKASLATMSNLYAVAISKDGDIYVADDSVNAARTARIRVIYAGGAKAAALISATNTGSTPVYGNIYRIAGSSGTLGSTGDGGLATSAIIDYSKGVAVDADGDVVFTDYNGASLTTITPGKVRVVYNGGATMAKLIALENSGTTPVVGYVYSIAGGNSSVASGTPATGNGGLASAATFAAPYGVTVDPAGDVFVADYTDRTIRKIDAVDGIIYPYAGASAQQGITNGNTLTTARFWDPFGLSLGSSGTVIIGEYGVYRVRNTDITAAGLTFAPVAKGSTGTAQYVYLLNQGTEPATIASVVASTNFTTVTLGSDSVYSKDCTKITTLAAGDACAVAVALQPTIGGTLTGTLTITDNSNGNAASKHTVSLTGSSGITTQVTLTSSANPTYAGNTVTYTAVVAATAGQDLTGAPALIGTVAFTDGTATLAGSPVTIDSTGTATITEGPLSASTHSIKAVFTPDSTISTTYAGATATLSEVSAALATTTTLTSSTANADLGAAVTLTATVTIPTTVTVPPGTPALAGTVTFTDTSNNNAVIAANVPVSSSGVATTPASFATAGTHMLSAVFTPTSIAYATSAGSYSQIVSSPSLSVTTTTYGVAVPTGSTVTVPLSVNSFGGYKGTAKGSCTGLPANLTCSFNPASITYAGTDNSVSDTLTIGTTGQTAAVITHTGRDAAELAGLLGAALLLFLPRRRKLGIMLAAAFALALATGLSGCSSGNSTATRGTFNINVVFSDGTISSAPVAITVSVIGNPGN